MITVREAAGLDCERLLAMMEDFNALERIPFDRDVMGRGLHRLLEEPSLGQAIVVELDGERVGYAIVTYGFDLEFGGRDAFLTEIYLVPEARGRGVGRTALGLVEERARAAGVRALHLMVYPENRPALALYERAGFQRSPRAFYTKLF
jgi:ribosomal protein S18 acetylase RimI-like enzyme